jgi:hypothetical protein
VDDIDSIGFPNNWDKSSYMIYKRYIDFGWSKELVHIALCMADHTCIGLGCSEDEAVDKMHGELRAKYGEADES